MDETFHGYNTSEGAEPSGEVLAVDTVMRSAHAAHGGFRLHYSDTVLCAANGRLWADWAVTGIRADALVALPYIGWLSQRHRLAVKVGWWEIALLVDGDPLIPYRVTTWYEAGALPTSEFRGGNWQAWSSCALLPDEPQLAHHFRITPPAPPHRWERLTFVLRGATTLGEEAGSPFDAVNGTVGDRAPLPSRLAADTRGNSLLITNAPAGLAAELRCSHAGCWTTTSGIVTLGSGERTLTRQQVRFEMQCPLEVPPEGDVSFSLALVLSEAPAGASCAQDAGQTPAGVGTPQEAGPAPAGARGIQEAGPALAVRSTAREAGLEAARPGHGTPGRRSVVSPDEARAAWEAEWECLQPLHTPDERLTAGLRRAAVYAASMLPALDGTEESAGLSDHVEWPVDCPRDCFHVASALLFLKPELARRHLAFYFLNALPRAGTGKSYVPTGESRGHRQARILDLAAYPLLELSRYWRATGDLEFVAQESVRHTASAIVCQVEGWQDPRTGMLTSTERSSDERCVYPLFVPGNAMIAGALAGAAEIAREAWADRDLADRMAGLAAEVRRGVLEHAVFDDPEFGPLFAFEVGRAGAYLLYDHADMPNLLSLPRFGFCPPDDPVYCNTVRFAYSLRNQGFRGTANGKYRALCDGSKTMPFSPWSLGVLGRLMSGAVAPAEAARLLDWLRDALTPALQLPEISDRHTARPVQRYWFAWPTSMLLMAYIEVICGVKIGPEMRVEPLVPEGWPAFRSPTLTIGGRPVQIEGRAGEVRVCVDGRTVAPGKLPHAKNR